MKKTYSRAGFIFLLLISFSSKAQDDVGLFVSDMLQVADDFASPAAEGAAYLSSAGWFSSARPLDSWQVDLSIHANVLFIPEKRRSTAIASSDYNTFNIRGAQNTEIPSAFGGTTEVVFEGQIFGQDFDFDAIEGINKKVLAHPFVQASVGMPYGTDVIVRFLPNTTVDGVEFGTYGIGLKHNFNQYLFNSQPTDFQFAALAAYSRYDVNYAFTPLIVEYEISGVTRSVVELENMEVSANLWLLQFISSKSFYDSGWELFAALGATNSDFGYVAGGGGDFLGEMNAALDTLNKNEMEVKGDVGFNYQAGNFVLSSMVSLGKFVNYNLGLHYRL